MQLDSALVRNFTRLFLLSKYDDPQPIPPFHNEMWDLCCGKSKYVAIAAPRGNAKSTAISLAYLMACVLFRQRQFVMLVSDTERQAIKFLGDIRTELRDNMEILQTPEFGLKGFYKDTETEIIYECKDGHKFCIMARGSGQNVRGTKWDNKRPDLIIGDDLENDEIVSNQDRREKFREWIYKQLLPCGSDNCVFRFVGTILHFDSFLNRCINPPKEGAIDARWKTLFFRSHLSFDDFSELLWPEKWPESRCRELRDFYINAGIPEGYSQEMLNHPIAEGKTVFRKAMFLPLKNPDEKLVHYAGIDFAISTKTRADKTSIKVAGMNPDGVLKYVYSIDGRWDSAQICDEMFAVQSRFDIDLFFAESDSIQKAIGPFLFDMMGRKDEHGMLRPFINVVEFTPSKDKRARNSALAARMKSGKVQWDKEADWYGPVEEEFCKFTGRGDVHDDHVDSAGIICLGLQKMIEAPTPEEEDEIAYHEEWGDDDTGRSVYCGY